MTQPSPFDQAMAELQGILVDIDGDGRPDAVMQPPQGAVPRKLMPQGNALQPGFDMLPAEQPQQNALAMGPPSVQMPIGRGMETEPRSMGVGPVPEAPNALAQFGRRALEDVTSDPFGALVEGPLQFLGAPGAGLGGGHNAMAVARSPGAAGGSVRAVREVTNPKANAWESIQYKASKAREADVDAVDYAKLPSHVLQGRDPKTQRFQKLPDEVKAQREQGRQRLQAEKGLEKRREVDADGTVWYRGWQKDAP
jgi:hypothetical protein